MVSQLGVVTLEFNQPMLLPQEIDHQMYAEIFKFMVLPAVSNDLEPILGKYKQNLTESILDRRLEKIYEIVDGLQFNFTVVNQT